MNKTEKALIARGVDSAAAQKLRIDGWTVSKLKTSSEGELKAAGLSKEFIENLFKEQRPPIPEDILSKLLFDNRFQCCVCREPRLSIIVHHIDDWTRSRSHAPDNLAVLCLAHHGDAHSKKELAQNLDPKTLANLKKAWEAEVKRFDSESILEAMRLDYSNWNYINELRVFEIAKKLCVDFSTINGFFSLVAMGVVEPDGLPAPVANQDSLFYKYEGPKIINRYLYASEVLSRVISMLAIVNVSDWLERGVLGFALVPGDFIFVQGAHTFSPLTNKKDGTGPGQVFRGYRTANHVEIAFTFDRWEATSSSAKNEWLSGTKNQGSLIHVKDMSRKNGKLLITGTVLGICSNFGNLKTREYATIQLVSGEVHRKYVHSEEDDDEDSDDETEFV
ncbi:MAG: HNH endonuclease [Stenotrophomonas sp.]|nr:HNH endonuclease [Stenotrophomonas sp.]